MELQQRLLQSLPALYNHVELCVTISQNPTQQFEINDWFEGICDVLKNRTEILKRNPCRPGLQGTVKGALSCSPVSAFC